jgi:hypothetical protein
MIFRCAAQSGTQMMRLSVRFKALGETLAKCVSAPEH